jgi:hypothetical protein
MINNFQIPGRKEPHHSAAEFNETAQLFPLPREQGPDASGSAGYSIQSDFPPLELQLQLEYGGESVSSEEPTM